IEKNIRLSCRPFAERSAFALMFALKVAHSSGGNANKHRSTPLVITIPPSKYGRSREGRVNRPFSSRVCSYSPRRARIAVLPLRPTSTHDAGNSCICRENAQRAADPATREAAKTRCSRSFTLPPRGQESLLLVLRN